MKASMRSDGTIHVEAENGVEAFALQCWHREFLKYPSESLGEKIVVSWPGDPPMSPFPPDPLPSRS